MYFDESLAHGELSTPLKDNHLSEDQAVPLAPNTEEAQEGQRTVRKRLLASNSKRQKRSPGKEDSTESKLKTPTKTPTKTPVAKTSAGKSTTKKSAKKTPTVSAKKKKRIAELESEVQEIEENISKLKKQSTNLKSKMTRLAKSEGEVKFPVKDELIEKMDPQGRPLEPLPVPLIKLEDLLPNEAIHDAIAVWNFINSFNKQLSVAVTWDDFIELLKFTHSTSQALIDLFSAPLKLIFSDSLSLNRLHATLPKKVHFSYRLGEEEREGSSQVGIAPSQLMMPNLNNFEDFDSQYNGLKLFPRKLQTDQVDSLRWNAILRGVFLRLEPIRQLRKAVSEANLALQYYQDQENRFSDAAESDPSILQFMHTLQELNRKYYFLPQWIQSRDWGNGLESSSSNKKVSFETPSKAERNGEDLVTFITTGKKIALDAETMSRINTPKSKSRNKSSGLNKDAIFNISSNFILNLHEYYEIANLLETKEVHELSPLQKLTILKVLCDACMDTDRIQQLMERNAEERANQIQQMNRLAKEQKLKMKEVSSTKREAALEACRRLNREKASDSKKGEKKEAQGGRKGNGGGKGSKAKSNFEPNVEQLSAMIDDLIGLEPYGIDTVREDPVLDEISESEDEEDDEEEASDEHETDGDNDEGEVKRGRSASRRKPALVRTRAMSRQRSRADRMQRNNTISYALERMTLALERNTERELRGAIKVAEKSGFKGVDEKTGQVYVTESLKQVYRQLNELEIKAKEDKLASKHEKALDDYFVRTEPLGSDRYHRTYWKFMADDNRLFVECKEEDEAMKAFGPCPPPPSSSKALDQIVLNRLFESRPNRYKYRWLVYSTSSELWKLCEALDDRGEREKELKAAIKARFEIEPPAVVYQTSGSEFIGRKVQRTFGRKTVYGTVVGWLPATEEDQALWHVVHVDGDEEDLDEDELKIALVEDEAEAVKEVSVQRDEDEAVQVKESVEELHSLNGRVDDGKDTDDQSEEDEVVVPAIAKKSAGLVRASHHSRSISVSGLHGVEGLAQECQRFLSIVSDSLKKKLGDQFSREEKKNFEQKLRDVESLEDLQKVVLEMEDLIHSCQTASDRREKDECQQAKEEERREMIEEGWTFDEVQCEFIGRRGRRYFSKFGISDGVIVAMLPAERNEGVTLFRMVHNDGDREDLESEDLLTALRYFDSNCTATDIRMELKEREGEDGEDSDDDDDDDLLVDDSSQFSNPRDSSEGLLWPTFEVRQRWKESVSRSCTTGELALAISCLEEHSYDFNLFGESDPILPLTLFSPPMDPETMRLLTQAGRYPQRQRGSAQNFHHEALSPRKAKKRAISEISKCQKEDTRSFSSDDFEPRRSKRVTGNAQTHSNHSSSNNQFYNSGRPSRSAAQKVVSYAV